MIGEDVKKIKSKGDLTMIHRVTCDRCGSISEYDDKSIWEGNREHEDIECPVCGNIIDSAFTDLTPVARLIKKGEKTDSNFRMIGWH